MSKKFNKRPILNLYRGQNY